MVYQPHYIRKTIPGSGDVTFERVQSGSFSIDITDIDSKIRFLNISVTGRLVFVLLPDSRLLWPTCKRHSEAPDSAMPAVREAIKLARKIANRQNTDQVITDDDLLQIFAEGAQA
jgi:hypothetical protein